MSEQIYKKRILETQKYLGEEDALILFASTHRYKNKTVEYKFRQDSDYFRLTGIEEEDGILFLKKDYSCHFSLPKDKEKEIWTGIRLGKEKIKESLGLSESFDLTEWDSKKEDLLTNTNTLFYFFGKEEKIDREMLSIISRLQMKLREGKFGPSRIEQPEFLHELRMIKTEEDLECIRKAVDITKKGFLKIMRRTKPEMYEYELEGILDSTYIRNGAWGGGYNHIVAGGKNAVILHYNTNREKLNHGDLILVDSGAEYGYFTADVTRCFPVGKKFSGAQKEIYELVLASQKNAISLTTAGRKFLDIHESTVRFLVEHLRKMKLLEGEVDSIIEKKEYMKFYPHKTGHWLGMDVHDVGRYFLKGESRPLRDGQITTVEPGLYFDPSDETIPVDFRGIGIRIEDDVLVNGMSPIVLTKEIPKEIDEIERLR
ncbi:MAG: aminopeptidase P family protein [Leptospiraceae bacterium]|nr:aminopeptidase P family protein [Leptospiraceae bacterium]